MYVVYGWDYWNSQRLLRKFMLKYFNQVHYDYCGEWANANEICSEEFKHESVVEEGGDNTLVAPERQVRKRLLKNSGKSLVNSP